MTYLASFCRDLRRDHSGATVIEMAILAPMFLILLLGIFTTADYMQNYNAMRSVAADVSREVVIAYQRENTLTEVEVEAIARGVAINTPYFLDTNQLSVDVTTKTTSRITNATELEIDLSYEMKTFIPIIPIPAITMQYVRPIFVANT